MRNPLWDSSFFAAKFFKYILMNLLTNSVNHHIIESQLIHTKMIGIQENDI